MRQLTIPIITDTKINSIFLKANSYVLKKHNDRFNSIKNYEEKLDLLKRLWRTEFFADLITDNKTPISVQFHNENSMTLFFFKFKN